MLGEPKTGGEPRVGTETTDLLRVERPVTEDSGFICGEHFWG